MKELVILKILFFIVIVLIFVFNFRWSVANNVPYWYYEASHFLMGFVLAGFLSTTFSLSNTHIMAIILACGIAWEFLEYAMATVTPLKTWLAQFQYHIGIQPGGDTALDLVLDAAGALLFIAVKYIL